MQRLGYEAPVAQDWGHYLTGTPRPYAQMLRKLAACRWLISLDTKGSAGPQRRRAKPSLTYPYPCRPGS